MVSSATLRVFRWTSDAAKGLAEYRVAAAADTTVLDALVEIQRAQDPTLAFRYASLTPADSIRPLRRLAIFRLLGLSR
jgi:succinate dehydrogenase/fumarate reductase-like Fe-S protein